MLSVASQPSGSLIDCSSRPCFPACRSSNAENYIRCWDRTSYRIEAHYANGVLKGPNRRLCS